MGSRLTRTAGLICAGIFLFFLIYSAPHRVHHFFEQSQARSQAHSHDHHDRPNHRYPAPNDSDCVFQAAASGCQLGVTALVQFFSNALLFANLTVPIASPVRQRFLFWAFHVRAPPQA